MFDPSTEKHNPIYQGNGDIPINPLIAGKEFKKDFAAYYDYCMVFPMDTQGKTDEQNDIMKHCMNNMLKSGLEIFPYPSVQVDEIYVLIRCPLEILKAFAGKNEFKLLGHERNLREALEKGDEAAKIAPQEITALEGGLDPYKYIYMEYNPRLCPSLYFKEGEPDKNPFTSVIRLKLIFYLLRGPLSTGGCNLELSNLLYKGKIKAFYPLHDRILAAELKAEIMALEIWPWQINVEAIKEYFGEKIALYNVFIGHYSFWLVIPSIVGVVFQLVVISTWSTTEGSSPVLPFYSLLITVWSVFMLEYWKRTEALTSLRWGTIGFEKNEPERPEFHGDIMKSHIDGSYITYYDPKEMSHKSYFSKAIIAVFMTLVLGTVTAIYVMRYTVLVRNFSADDPVPSLITSLLNTLQITVFNFVYQIIAVKLTDHENHRTDTEYEDSLIVKLFVFQFINSFSSFFFLAFVAGYINSSDDDDIKGACGARTCMYPLMINLAIIFGLRLTVTNALEIFIPWVTYKLKVREETSGLERTSEGNVQDMLTEPEKDYVLMPYVINLENIKNYADTAVQYGFTLLFIPCLPCATFLSLINNYAKVKFEAWKQFSLYQRPVPVACQDIGTWQHVFTIISVISVATNAGLIVFTMDLLWERYSLFGRMWIFVGFQWVLILIQVIATFVITDVPEEVEYQSKRIDFIESKLVKKVPDDDFGNAFTPTLDDAELEDYRSFFDKLRCRPKKTNKSLAKKITGDLDKFPILRYPNKDPNSWPVAMTAMNVDSYVTNGEAGRKRYGDYMSELTALGKQGEVQRNNSGYRAAPTSDVTYY